SPASFPRRRRSSALFPPVHRPGRARGAVRPQGLLRGKLLDRDSVVAAVGDQRQAAPRRLEGALAEHAVAPGAAIQRNDLLLSQQQQARVVREPGRVPVLPAQDAALEGGLGQRVGDPFLESGEARELLAPALAYRLAQLAVEIAEEEERLPAAPLLAHEQKRRRRGEELDRRQGLELVRLGQRQEPFSHRAVADLVVVLQEIDEA